MFTMYIVDSDAFLDMPLSAQCLYFHLNMRADDDGFIGNPKRIQKLVGANEDDLKLLIAKRFVLIFEDGVIVIKHWKMHNTLRSDRYTPTRYTEELLMLETKENNSYTLVSGNQMATTRQPSATSDIDIGLDIDKDKDTNIDEFFEAIWKLYPNKLGKGAVKQRQKHKLYLIGFETLSKCIDRYVSTKEDWKKYKDGSTFFNGGYIDFLDENFVDEKKTSNPFKETSGKGGYQL